MDLRSCIEAIRRHEKELLLCNVDAADPIADDLAAYFETQNVRIATARTASGAPSDLAVLSTSEEVLAVVDVDTLRDLMADVPAGSGGTGVGDAAHERILGHLKETTFTSYDTEQLLYASREIEDRARRVGGGTIHAGFQYVSRVADQRAIYADLAGRGVDVHAYGVPDATPPDLGAGRVHAVGAEEIEATWFVAFDGGGADAQKSALLAEQRDGDGFYGAWTYDAPIVDRAIAHLERTYVPDDARTRRG